MLEVLLVPLVTSAAGRLVKALVNPDDAEDAGALSAALVKALFARRDTTAAAIKALSDQVKEVREKQWDGPYKKGLDQLEKSGRPGVTPEHRAVLLQKAGDGFADAKGAAPEDPELIAALDVYTALVWLAQGHVVAAKEQLTRTAAELEEAILPTHVAAAKEMAAWTQFHTDRSRETAVESAARAVFGSLMSTTPPNPLDPGGSYVTLIALIRDHASLQRLRTSVYAIGDPCFPVALASPSRREYDAGNAAIIVDQPRHVTAMTFGLTATVSLAPHGPNRAVTFTVHNGRARAIEVRTAATTGPPVPTDGALGASAAALPPGDTLNSDHVPTIVLSEPENFVLELGIATGGGQARVVVPFAPDEDAIMISFQDHRALEVARRAMPPT